MASTKYFTCLNCQVPFSIPPLIKDFAFPDDFQPTIDLLEGRINSIACPVCGLLNTLLTNIVVVHKVEKSILCCIPEGVSYDEAELQQSAPDYQWQFCNNYQELYLLMVAWVEKYILSISQAFLSDTYEQLSTHEQIELISPLFLRIFKGQIDGKIPFELQVSGSLSSEEAYAILCNLYKSIIESHLNNLLTEAAHTQSLSAILAFVEEKIPRECITKEILDDIAEQCLPLPDPDQDPQGFLSGFLFEYLNAIVHAHAETMNPRRKIWAMYMTEVWVLSKNGQGGTIDSPFLLPPEVLQRILRFEDLWDVNMNDISDQKADQIRSRLDDVHNMVKSYGFEEEYDRLLQEGQTLWIEKPVDVEKRWQFNHTPEYSYNLGFGVGDFVGKLISNSITDEAIMSGSEDSVRDIPDQQSDVCPNCGFRDNALKGYGPLCVILDTAYMLLRDLFLKQVDDYHCPTCERSMHLRPTVIVVLNEKSEYLYCFGDRALAVSEELRKQFSDGLKSEVAQVEAFSTLDELRLAYAKRVASIVDHITQGIEAASGDNNQGLHAGAWRDFPSNHFVAAALILSTPLPSVEVGFPDSSTPEAMFDSIVGFQVDIWLSFCVSWSGELENGRTLEGDLSRYLAPDAMLEEAADEFLRETEDPQLWTPLVRFCLEAVRASLCVWRNKPNPRLREWADLFVEQEVARRILGEQSPHHLVAMEISAERAHDTIPYEKLFNACARKLMESELDILPQLQEIGQKVGYPYLAAQLFASFRTLPDEGQVIGVDKLLESLRTTYKGGSPEPLLAATSKLLVVLGEKPSSDTLGHIADGLKEILGKGLEIHARVEAWLCSHLLRDGLPKVVLERIGDKAQPWEQELSPHMRAHLWTERSNALRMCGRGAEAVAITEAVIADLKAADEPISPELRRDLGILYREAGLHEQALEIFLELLPDTDPDLRLILLDSIYVTYSSLGRYADTIPYLEELVQLARGPRARSRPRVLAGLAAAKSAVGERSEALTLLRQIPVGEADDLEVLLPYASAWINVAQHPELLENEDTKRLSDLVTKIKRAYDATLHSGNMLIHMHAGRLLAILGELTQVGPRNIFWELVDVGAREFEGAPDPLALAALARDAWVGGESKKARDYLLEIPAAVAKRYTSEHDISLKIDALGLLRWMFEKLVGLADHSGSFEDLRLVAELKRDMLGRIAAASAGDRMAPLAGFVAPDTQTIVQLGWPIAIFEWVDGLDGVLGLATFNAADGTVIESYLSPFEVNLDRLAERITQRLSTWHPGRAGTPLDDEDWRSFENRLAKELEGRLPEGGRLVVIEHEEMAGLQWHLAAAPRWRVSYAPSWSALLTPRQAAGPDKVGAIGLAMVPKYREAEDNLRALESSVSRTVQAATELGRRLNSALREACDRNALVGVLEGTTVAKILCHGFVDPDEDVVALMVAHDGELPLGNSSAANTPSGRQHRFDWRDCQHLRSAPPILFSAACGSGQSHRAGLGEELGLFSTLRRVGTRSVIAPRWDIEPKVVLPILDNAMERYLRTGVELGEALHAACSEASEVLPHWQAWALALEGDWK